MNSKYNLREVQTHEIEALFWDEEKGDYVFPSREIINVVIEESESRKPAEGFEPPTPSSFG